MLNSIYDILSPGLFTGTTKSGNERGHVRVHSTDLKSNTSNQDDLYEKSQVVAVGTALPTLGIPVNSQQAQVVVSRLIFTSFVVPVTLRKFSRLILNYQYIWDFF